VNDRYDLPFSIKDYERDQWAAKYSNIANVFPSPKDSFSGAADFNKLMVNSSNKTRLQKIVKDHFTAKIGLYNNVAISYNAVSTTLRTGVNDENLVFKHAETDTILFSLCAN
jgi:hypothetical protein